MARVHTHALMHTYIHACIYTVLAVGGMSCNTDMGGTAFGVMGRLHTHALIHTYTHTHIHAYIPSWQWEL